MHLMSPFEIKNREKKLWEVHRPLPIGDGDTLPTPLGASILAPMELNLGTFGASSLPRL